MSKARAIIVNAIGDTLDEMPISDVTRVSDAILSALRAAGLVVVPVEPTLKMMRAGEFRLQAGFDENVYRAMIAASQEDKG